MHGSGQVAASVRDQLYRIPIVLTDAAALVRELDLEYATDKNQAPFTLALTHSGQGNDPFAVLARGVKQFVRQSLLYSSGVGSLQYLTNYAPAYAARSNPHVVTVREVDRHLPTLRSVIIVASKASVLTLPERHADAITTASASSPVRFISMADDEYVAHAQLQSIADTQTVFDSGESAATRVVEELRMRAALSAARLWPYDRHDSHGFADEGTDTLDWNLQAADVAAGFARESFGRHGFEESVSRFTSVYYNGALLNPDRACQLDQVMRAHERFCLGCA